MSILSASYFCENEPSALRAVFLDSDRPGLNLFTLTISIEHTFCPGLG